MEVLYLLIQSKSEDSSSSLVCFLILFNYCISFLFRIIQLRFTNTSTRGTTIASTIKDNGTKSISILYNLSFPYKDRRSNKENSTFFIEWLQIFAYTCFLIHVSNESFLAEITSTPKPEIKVLVL